MEPMEMIMSFLLRLGEIPRIFSSQSFSILWDQYSNFNGFVIGTVIVNLIAFLTKEESGRIKGGIRIFAIIALINSIDIVYYYMSSYMAYGGGEYDMYHHIMESKQMLIIGAYNPFSMMLLALVISQCYKNKQKQAFAFGLCTFLVSTIMSYRFNLNSDFLGFMGVRIIGFSLICAIGSKVKELYVFYTLMGGFFIVTEVWGLHMLHLTTYCSTDNLISKIIQSLKSINCEVVTIVCIVGIIILFHNIIIKNKSVKAKY